MNLKPAGERLMEDFYYAGGLPAVLEQIRDLLHLDALTVTGETLGENLDATATEIIDETVIRPRAEPLDEGGSLVVLRGNLCPDGAVMKISAADPRLLATRVARSCSTTSTTSPRASTIRISTSTPTRHGASQRRPGRRAGDARVGPHADPGQAPARTVSRDLLRISDARMSGTSYGAVVLHVAPESAVGGPLALVQTGDRIRLDVESRTLDLLIDEAELERRRASWTPPGTQGSSAATGSSTRTMCCRQTRAATSISCAGGHR